MNFTFSISGRKEEALNKIDAQVQDKTGRALLETIINEAPGNRVSISGHFAASEDDKHGTMTISGSFWTET